jgi:Uma2 family endonuclease
MTMATVEQGTGLLTAEEFAKRPETDMAEELVRGRVVTSPLPGRRHGSVCFKVGYCLGRYLQGRPIGRGVGNDAGIMTERDPDTVRGPDVTYYSFERLSRNVEIVGYGPEVPELVFEVLSPSDRWSRMVVKAGEYLDAGVSIVVVLDPKKRSAWVFRAHVGPSALGPEDAMRLEPILPGFEVVVGRLFG